MASRVLKTGENQITTKFSNAHKAVDLVKYKSQLDTIVAHSDGKVVRCQIGQKNNKGSTGNASYGNFVKIKHADGYSTLYAHLDKVKVSLGQVVKQGQEIGTMGNTGNSYGAHLHFEVRLNEKKIDPTDFLENDLPITKKEKIHVSYRTYTGKWLPWVVDYNEENSNGYAGINRKPATALLVKPDKGLLRYRVHLLEEKRWLPWVSNAEDYAGNIGQEIDAIQMELLNVEGYQVKYRVSPKNSKKWYLWCNGLSDGTGDGYAGVFGVPIDCIQIYIE